jgi:hypothetical protein
MGFCLEVLHRVGRRRPCWLILNGGCFLEEVLFRAFQADNTRYDPIQKFGPQDCIASINAIVDKIDALVKTKNTKAIQELKEIFGLGALKDIRDFAATIAFPREYIPSVEDSRVVTDYLVKLEDPCFTQHPHGKN